MRGRAGRRWKGVEAPPEGRDSQIGDGIEGEVQIDMQLLKRK